MGQLLEKVIWDQRTSSFLSVYFIRCAGKDSPRHGKSILRCVCGIRVSNSIGSWEWLLSFWPSGFVSVGITSMLYHTWLKIRVQDSQHARQALYHLSTSPAHRASQALFISLHFVGSNIVLSAWDIAGVWTVPLGLFFPCWHLPVLELSLSH